MSTPQIGDKVDNFSATATNDLSFKLNDYSGKPVLLYFYPRDNTPGCTQEGKDFRDNYAQFQEKQVEILGISRDSLKVHENFKAKHEFPFELISDKDEAVCQLFDVIKEKKMYGKTHMGIERSTFLINSEGKLVAEWRKVKVKEHIARFWTQLKNYKGNESYMAPRKKNKRHLYILDTNVLIHDPTALFRFDEHDIFLPMVVLEELDNNKKGHSEVAQNARQASRFLADLTLNVSPADIKKGISLNTRLENINADEFKASSGRLYFQTDTDKHNLPVTFPGHKNDNDILGISLALQQEAHYPQITLVSKDINLRIKAAAIGVNIEDYHNDQALEDVNLLYKGCVTYAADFWEEHEKAVESWSEEGRTYHRIEGDVAKTWLPNQFVKIKDEGQFEVIVRSADKKGAVVERIHNYNDSHTSVWGITARNTEQNYALNLLMDPEIDFVSLVGQAGTGKTLLTLAAGLAQTMDNSVYREIIMTRVTISVGEDIGFLPGTEEEKMAPWMGALMDNMEVLTSSGNESGNESEWGKAATNDLLSNKIKIRALNFMRGRTFLNRFIIIDEAQNLTSKQMKTLITRAGPGSKIVCLGNVAQIDTPYLTETTSGLTFVVDRFRSWEHSGHITLQRGERSRLADFAAEVL